MPDVTEGAVRIERMVPARPHLRDHSVASHLAHFAIGILVPVLMIVTFLLFNTARLWRDDALHDAATFARHLNATLDVEMEKAIAVGQTLATSLTLANGDYAAFDGQARDVAKRLGMVVVARDLTGQQIASSLVPLGYPLPKSNDLIIAVDRLAAERKAPVISDLVAGTVLKDPFVMADIPVLKGPDVAWFIDVVLYPDRIAEILSQDLPNGWIVGVTGRDGRLIARNAEQARYIGTANPQFPKLTARPEGVWTGTTREGVETAGVYVRSPLSGWVVSVGVPESELRAPAYWAMVWLSGLVAVALCVSLWLGLRLSRRIAQPIRDLVTRARELGEGRDLADTPSSVAEVNDVTVALRAASVELDRRAEAEKLAAEAVRANEERLQLAQSTAGIGTIDWDIAGDRAICSPEYLEMFSLPPDSQVGFGDFIERVHPADRERIERSRRRLFSEGGGPFEDEFRVLTEDGDERWIFAKGQFDVREGRAVRLLAASIDITERKRSEDHLRFLLREISHRSKNLLAVIQAMAGQTAKSAESVDVFRRRFGERLMGMAASHDLLVNQNWLGASVENLVRGQLAPFVDENDARVRLHGPAVDLKSEAAEGLGLALHELATNSLKFGALSDQGGTVEISWSVDGTGESGGVGPREGGRRFRMEWVEHAGFPVSPPSHKGFGRMVIEHTVEATLNGKVTLDFPPDGLRWRIDAPDTCLAPPDQGMAA